MAALLAKGDEPAIAETNQETGVIVARIMELEHAPFGYIAICRDPFLGHWPLIVPQAHGPDPALPRDERPAGQHQELRVLPAGQRIVGGDIGREVLPPARLLGKWPVVGEAAVLFAWVNTHNYSSQLGGQDV